VMDLEQSRADAHAVMKFLLPFQKQQKENTASEAYSFMISLFASIAEALTAEFTPYLEHVIPPLIHSAQKQTVSIYKKQKDEQKQRTAEGECSAAGLWRYPLPGQHS